MNVHQVSAHILAHRPDDTDADPLSSVLHDIDNEPCDYAALRAAIRPTNPKPQSVRPPRCSTRSSLQPPKLSLTKGASAHQRKLKLYREVKALRISQLRHMSCISRMFAQELLETDARHCDKLRRRHRTHIRHLALLYAGQINQVKARYA